MDSKTYESLGLHRSMTDVDRAAGGQRPLQPRDPAGAGDAGRPPVPPQPRGRSPPTGRRAARCARTATGPARAVYPGTMRDLWIYTPAGFDPAGPAPALMVFQDGGGYLEPRRPGARRGGVRHPDRRRRDAADDRRLRHARPPGGLADTAAQPRVRQRHRRLCALPAGGRAAVRRGRDRLQADRRPGAADHLRHLQRRHLRLHRGLVSGRTRSAGCSATAARSPPSAAATTTPT